MVELKSMQPTQSHHPPPWSSERTAGASVPRSVGSPVKKEGTRNMRRYRMAINFMKHIQDTEMKV